jgi:hypothetical protein
MISTDVHSHSILIAQGYAFASHKPQCVQQRSCHSVQCMLRVQAWAAPP